MIGTESWLEIAASLGALVDAEGRSIPARIARDGRDDIIVGCDLGNSAIKIVLRQADAPQLRAFRFDAVYTPAAIIRAGVDGTACRVFGNAVWREWFWLDDEDGTTGEALPIGATAERLANPRLRDFLCGALVEAMERSRYAPGAYTLWLGLGLPNEEISSVGVSVATRQALRQLHGQAMLVERRDPTGTVTTWSLTIGEFVPAAQSLGSFFAWYHTLAGQPAVGDVDLVTVVDLGGGHLSRFDVEIIRRPQRPQQFSGTGGILGEGMVMIAGALIELVRERYRVRLSESVALYALITGAIPANGRRVLVHDLIAQAIQTRGQHLLATLTPILTDHRRLPIFSGGGAICLGAELDWRASAAGRAPEAYLSVPTQVASTLNTVGLFALAVYAAQRGT